MTRPEAFRIAIKEAHAVMSGALHIDNPPEDDDDDYEPEENETKRRPRHAPHCPSCDIVLSASRKETPRSRRCSMCERLFKMKQYCRVCEKVWFYGEVYSDANAMAQCDTCGFWNHAGCDAACAKALKSDDDDAKYFC